MNKEEDEKGGGRFKDAVKCSIRSLKAGEIEQTFTAVGSWVDVSTIPQKECSSKWGRPFHIYQRSTIELAPTLSGGVVL
jgi:hypothetical protein